MQDLKQLRKAKGLTQNDVAKELGVSQQAYAKYESGQVAPNEETLDKLHTLFGAKPNDYLSNGCGGDATVEEFLNTSYTAYHTVLNAVSMLEDWGFEKVDLPNPNLKVGGKYYLTKNSSAVIAFKVGDLSNYTFMIAGSHTDSPCYRVKGNLLLDSAEGKRFNVEKYGGMLAYSFLDIPLKLAGRVFVKTASGVKEQIVESNRLFNVPSLCIHHNPNANEGLTLTTQNDMCPLVGEGKDVYSFVADDIVVGADLFVSPAVKAYESGNLLCSPRIDNLTSVYSSLKAIKDSNPKGIAIAACFDNEEIGSGTKQGAGSALLCDVLRMINRGLCKNDADFDTACRNGFALSIDNGHAVHPAHPEKSDPLERVYLNRGVVIKHHTNYSSDGLSSAIVKTILDKAGVEHQDYYNNSDIRCGGTIGLITSRQLEMNACDIGLAQLAMHSAIETVGKSDVAKMQACVRAFFDTSLRIDGADVKVD
ncbi:MAG: M18 family aminopeptidase [Clostridia bacterium]|nr:M18 family aminopeptidase [Clostridia bacterium]